jgi:hypothetical protein
MLGTAATAKTSICPLMCEVRFFEVHFNHKVHIILCDFSEPKTGTVNLREPESCNKICMFASIFGGV